MGEPRHILTDVVPEALYQNIVEACRVCDGYSLEEVLLCPRCIATREKVELVIQSEIKSRRKELFCNKCRFLCWLGSYMAYRKIAQYFPGWKAGKKVRAKNDN